MALEIERKFLVRPGWLPDTPGVPYVQGYLTAAGEVTVRARIAGDRAFLTLKTPSRGLVRDEYEYEIPLADAQDMLMTLAAGRIVAKNRHFVEYGGFTWEVDVFKGANAGLVLAEIELDAAERQFPLPDWAGDEVSDDVRYRNRYLAGNPYSAWK